MKRTPLQQQAQQLGFPASLFGFTPDVAAYWWELNLLSVADPAATALAGLAPDSWEFVFSTDEMAPHFSLGTPVILAPAPSSHPLQVGRVYVRFPAHGEPEVGRLAEVHDAELVLLQDNSPAVLRWPLEEGTLYAVTHYVDYSRPRAYPSPRYQAVTRPYLLELDANQMGPRYPKGARYLSYLVPPARWAEAQGVHALQLHGGGEVLARLVGTNCATESLVTLFDGPNQLGSIALADVAQLWKLGAANYLPEETEDEHWDFLQRPLA